MTSILAMDSTEEVSFWEAFILEELINSRSLLGIDLLQYLDGYSISDLWKILDNELTDDTQAHYG